MDDQISMFEMLEMDDTPTIPFEKQKRGVKGWVIEISAILLPENGYEKRMVGVTTEQVVLNRDSYERNILGRIEQWQDASSTGVGGCKGNGWVSSPKKLYVRKPKWRELQEYVQENYKEPYDEIVYVYKDGYAMHHIGVYD